MEDENSSNVPTVGTLKLNTRNWTMFKFKPQSDITAYELAQVFEATLRVAGMYYDHFPDEVKRHFTE